MLAVDLPTLVQTILFLLFADITALVAAVVGPTYDNLLVPELAPHALYPAVLTAAPGPSNYLAPAASFASYVIGGVVDPLVALLAVGIALLYFARASLGRWALAFEDLLPRLVLSVVAANFTVPIAAAILSLAGGLYPVVAGWDGGSWQHWENLAGPGEIFFSWDNGALAFVLSLVQFLLVVALVLAVGLRDALLAVLLVVLPLVTLLWPFRPLAAIPRRAWLLFVELAFLPSVLVVPLELAVGAPSVVLLVGYLSAALASPFLLSTAGAHLVALGFPSGSNVAQAGVGRGLSAAPGAATGMLAPAVGPPKGGAAAAAGTTLRATAAASGPLAVPAALHAVLGHGVGSVARHVGAARSARPPRLPPLRPGGRGEDGRT